MSNLSPLILPDWEDEQPEVGDAAVDDGQEERQAGAGLGEGEGGGEGGGTAGGARGHPAGQHRRDRGAVPR